MSTSNTMTDEQINIKIDFIIGGEQSGMNPLYRYYPKTGRVGWCRNYAADLNACHEFEKTLDTYELAEYWHNLLRAHGHIPEFAGCSDARQRCEAFLRVHGQWEEEV